MAAYVQPTVDFAMINVSILYVIPSTEDVVNDLEDDGGG